MAAKNSRRFEFKLGKTGMMVFVLGVSLLIFFSFIFGVTVGKNIEAYPEKLARGVPTMIKEQLGLLSGQDDQLLNKPVQNNIIIKDRKKDFDLTFYDTLAGKKGNTETVGGNNKEELKSSIDDAKQRTRADVKTMPIKPDASATEKVENSVASVSPPVPRSDKGTSTPRIIDAPDHDIKRSNNKYLIQVVSFQEKSKADGISKKLTAMGYKPRVITAVLPGKGKWFRVVLTGFDSRQDAQKVSGTIAKSVSGINCVVLAD